MLHPGAEGQGVMKKKSSSMRRASHLRLCLGGSAVDGVKVGEDPAVGIIDQLILTNTQEEIMIVDLSVEVEDTLDFRRKSRVRLTDNMVICSIYLYSYPISP